MGIWTRNFFFFFNLFGASARFNLVFFYLQEPTFCFVTV